VGESEFDTNSEGKRMICPLKNDAAYRECMGDDCAWWVPDMQYPQDSEPVDKGWCVTREIASKLGWLRQLDNEY